MGDLQSISRSSRYFNSGLVKPCNSDARWRSGTAIQTNINLLRFLIGAAGIVCEGLTALTGVGIPVDADIAILYHTLMGSAPGGSVSSDCSEVSVSSISVSSSSPEELSSLSSSPVSSSLSSSRDSSSLPSTSVPSLLKLPSLQKSDSRSA